MHLGRSHPPTPAPCSQPRGNLFGSRDIPAISHCSSNTSSRPIVLSLPFSIPLAVSTDILDHLRVPATKLSRTHRRTSRIQHLAVPLLPTRPAQPTLPGPQAAHQDAHARRGRRGVGVLRGTCAERGGAWGAGRDRAGGAGVQFRWDVDDRGVQEGVQPARRAETASAEGEGEVLWGCTIVAPAGESG